MRAVRWLSLLALGVIAACGGHTGTMLAGGREDTNEVGGSANAKQSDSDVSGAATARAGSSAASGGSASSGGSGSASGGARSSTAGAPSVGTAGNAGSCTCRADPGEIACEPGYVLSLDPERCCHCVLDCPSVGCLDLDCPAGSHEAQEDDECCPSCVMDQPLSCDEAQQKYDERRGQLLEKHESLGCVDDAGCAQFWEDNRCNLTCGTPIPIAAQVAIEDELETFAEGTCGNCPRQKPIPCARPLPSTCVDGRCQ
jgi:hypothetical protein